jgi:hypothetical protein
MKPTLSGKATLDPGENQIIFAVPLSDEHVYKFASDLPRVVRIIKVTNEYAVVRNTSGTELFIKWKLTQKRNR